MQIHKKNNQKRIMHYQDNASIQSSSYKKSQLSI